MDWNAVGAIGEVGGAIGVIVFYDGATEFQSFEERKQFRYHTMITPLLATFEGGLEHAKDGAVKPALVEAMHAAIARELERPGARAWWETLGRQTFSKDFADVVDGIVKPH